MGDDGAPLLSSMCPVVIVVTRYQTDYLSSVAVEEHRQAHHQNRRMIFLDTSFVADLWVVSPKNQIL